MRNVSAQTRRVELAWQGALGCSKQAEAFTDMDVGVAYCDINMTSSLDVTASEALQNTAPRQVALTGGRTYNSGRLVKLSYKPLLV